MKSIIPFIIISLISFSSFSKKKEPLEKNGLIKTTEGEFIDMYGTMTITNITTIQYQDEKGKYRIILQTKLEWVYWGGHVWFMVGKEKKDKSFLEMMAMNEKYKLFYASDVEEPILNRVFCI